MSQFLLTRVNGIILPLLIAYCLLVSGCSKNVHMLPEPLAYNGLYQQSKISSIQSPRPSVKAEPRAQNMFTALDNAPQAGKSEAKRLIHYEGYLKLLVSRPSEVIDRAMLLATSIGGYVERMDNSNITLRVPVADFKTVYEKAAKLGDVLNKHITAHDISESFQDLDMRLKIAKATRKRLTELLAKSEDEKEKLEILKEIQRLTREIETCENQLRILNTLAKFSTLTIELEKRQEFGGRTVKQDIAEFDWIRQLSPFDALLHKRLHKRLNLAVPPDMVLLNKSGLWVAESADGAVMRASKRLNKPAGDTDFWIEAIRTRLAPEFASAEIMQAGSFKILRLLSQSDDPYRYLVGVSSAIDQDFLYLIEVYYPTQAHEERYGKSILDSVARGEK